MQKINVAIIGASGYTGLELIKSLIQHPHFKITYIATTEGDIKATQLHPSLVGVFEQDVYKVDTQEVAKQARLAFLALPHKTAMGVAKELLALGVKVVDLSADYRLELEAYEKHYGEHEDKENLKEAIYGLPELNREKIKEAYLVANPGCYPTASLLGLLPFLGHLNKEAPIFIDAKSGVSARMSITMYENFVPQLLPITRGMLVSSYIQTREVIDAKEILNTFYAKEYFVRVREVPVDIKSVAGTNFCDIFVAQKGKSIFISSAIDNLLRGASSQAIVNANLMCGLDEQAGIPMVAYVP